jgi:hypothetical protein
LKVQDAQERLEKSKGGHHAAKNNLARQEAVLEAARDDLETREQVESVRPFLGVARGNILRHEAGRALAVADVIDAGRDLYTVAQAALAIYRAIASRKRRTGDAITRVDSVALGDLLTAATKASRAAIESNGADRFPDAVPLHIAQTSTENATGAALRHIRDNRGQWVAITGNLGGRPFAIVARFDAIDSTLDRATFGPSYSLGETLPGVTVAQALTPTAWGEAVARIFRDLQKGAL